MAWTSRQDRWGEREADERPGPGAYIGPRSIEVKPPCFAPFGSSAEKVDPADVPRPCGGPAPGSYDPKAPRAYDPGLPRKTVPFLTSALRDKPLAKDTEPGPGSYVVVSKPQVLQVSRTMGEAQPTQKGFFRSASAPSIPQTHQSFGYEEAGNGRLVRQAPKQKDKMLTGRPGDSAGPGHYNSSSPSKWRHSMGGCLSSAPRLDGQKQVETPGPGHYLAKVPSAPAVVSSFVSTVQARQSLKTDEMPGPGQYSLERPKRKSLAEQHQELQFFGSTCQRFQKVGVPAPNKLGPGSYSEPPRRLKVAIKPFSSSVGRFQEGGSVPSSKTPGPGEYNPADAPTTSGTLGTVSILGAMGSLAFGSMERRRTLASTKQENPGPGAYINSDSEVDPAVKRVPRRRMRAPSSSFRSATPKEGAIVPAKAQAGPAPGEYSPAYVGDLGAVVRLPAKSEGFGSAGPRWSKSSTGPAPGPGKYNPAEITCGKRVGSFNRAAIEGAPQSGRPRGLGFETQDKRFRYSSVDKLQGTPGPGSYKTDPDWITKTYNVYFGDVL